MKNSQFFNKAKTINTHSVSNIIFLILSLFLIASSNSSEVERKSTAQIINTSDVREDSLDAKAKKLTELYDNKNCKEFFKTFPNTFQELNKEYSYDENKEVDTLFSKYPEHFSYFFNCLEVSDLEKLNKVIRIGIDGKYNDAVPIGLFQDLTFDLIKEYPNQAKEILDKLPDEKASSFWYFLFDRPHPTDKENVKKIDLLKSLLGKDGKQSKLLSEKYQKLETDWKNH
ncbi:MAG: hypothetical protein ACR2F2_13240 [Pyrinomonadaceae bacterium]